MPSDRLSCSAGRRIDPRTTLDELETCCRPRFPSHSLENRQPCSQPCMLKPAPCWAETSETAYSKHSGSATGLDSGGARDYSHFCAFESSWAVSWVSGASHSLAKKTGENPPLRSSALAL